MKKFVWFGLIVVVVCFIFYFLNFPTISPVVGHWSYVVEDEEGYSTGFDMELTQKEKEIIGEFSAVWSFPKAPAARINTGPIVGVIGKDGMNANVTWEGDRGETGTATITFVPQNKTIMWKTNSVTSSDGFTFGESMVFRRIK